jgi:hypothetical protein
MQRVRGVRAASAVGLLLLAACGSSKIEGYDCPSADDLAEGVSVQCGSAVVVGTRAPAATSSLPACADGIASECRVTGAFRAVRDDALTSDNIKSGVTIGGVTGTLTGGMPCSFEAQDQCVVGSPYVAADGSTLASRLAVGEQVGDIKGLATVPALALCSANGEQGCKTHAGYVAVESVKAIQCLTLTLTGEASATVGSRIATPALDLRRTEGRLDYRAALATCKAHAGRLATPREALRLFVDGAATPSGAAWTQAADGTPWTVDVATGEARPRAAATPRTLRLPALCLVSR